MLILEEVLKLTKEMESLIIVHDAALEERSRNLLECLCWLLQQGALREQRLCRQCVKGEVEKICLGRWIELSFLPFFCPSLLWRILQATVR